MRRAPQYDETTRRPSASEARADGPSVTLLTVLSHPDLRRVGERAVLAAADRGGAVELGRYSPRFAPLGSPWNDCPLDDPYLSRKPWTITGVEQGLELARGSSSTELRLEGVPVDEVAFVADESLELGLTLELSDRIALLLHRAPESSVAATDTRRPVGEMVGASAGMLRVRRAIERVADLDVPALLRGESGTGKELVARALHHQSRRSSGPFVAVDLGVLSPSLAASELFGHAKGAFTGAQHARDGFFRAAEGGTLFLDEVGEATPEVQAMLLRALETRQVVPVGSHQPIPVDVRLVAATDSDLVARARRGDFKEPLLHRLAAYIVELPPLRERREDLGRLLVHLARPVLRELGEEHRLDAPEIDGPPWLPAATLARLAREPWPGNVRQLANVVRQLVIDSRGETQLQDRLLRSRLDLESPEMRAPETPAIPPAPTHPPTIPSETLPTEPGKSVDAEETRKRPSYRHPSEVSETELEEAMDDCGFEPAAAARSLGISRPTLYKLVRQHPTLRLAPDIPVEELELAMAEVGGHVTDAAHRLGVSRRALHRRLTQLGLHPGDDHAS